jgi:hypothetical protein
MISNDIGEGKLSQKNQRQRRKAGEIIMFQCLKNNFEADCLEYATKGSLLNAELDLGNRLLLLIINY